MPSGGYGATDIIIGGATNQSVVFALDTGGLAISGMKLSYVRWLENDGSSFTEGGPTTLTELAAITTAHTDNYAKYLDTDSSGGSYFLLRVDFPDAAFATGAHKVICSVLDDGNNVMAHRIFDLFGQDFMYNGEVSVDTVNGSAGTQNYFNGTPTNPSSSIASAKTIADAMGFNRFRLQNTLTVIDLAAIDMSEGYDFVSDSMSGVDLGPTANVTGCSFRGCWLKDGNPVTDGGAGDFITAIDSRIGAAAAVSFSIPKVRGSNITFVDTVRLNEAGKYSFANVSATTLTDSVCVLDFNNEASGDPGVSAVVISGFKGTLTVKNMLTTDSLVIDGEGQITFDSSCNSGTATAIVGGGLKVTNNATALDLTDNTIYAKAVDIEIDTNLIGYQDGFVYVNDAIGAAGQVLGVNGTIDNPCSNLTDARVLAEQLGKRLAITGDFISQTLDFSGYYIRGYGASSTLDGDATTKIDLNLAFIENMILSGGLKTTGGVGAVFHNCIIGDIDDYNTTDDGIAGKAFDCLFNGNIRIRNSSVLVIKNGASRRESTEPNFYFYDSINTDNLQINGWKGPIVINTVKHANKNINIYADGIYVTLHSNITAGTIKLLGSGHLEDNKTAATLDITDFIDNEFAATTALAKYPEGGIFFDAGAAGTGTTLGTHGTSDNPVNSAADAVTLATALGTKKIFVRGGTLALGNTDVPGFTLEGLCGNLNVTTNSPSDVAFTKIVNLDVALGVDVPGVGGTNGPVLIGSRVTNATTDFTISGEGELIRTLLGDVAVKGENGTIKLNNCITLEGFVTDLDAVNNTLFDVVNHVGDLKLINETAGNAHRIHMQGGAIEIASTCTSGSVVLSGWGILTDNSGGGFTVTTTEWHDAKIGDPVDLGDGASLSDMLTSMASITPGAASFDRTTDSQEAIRNLLPHSIKKNTAIAKYKFVMLDSTTGEPETGLTVTAQRSLDDSAFTAMANSVTERSNGVYEIDIAAADTNCTTGAWKFTASGAKDTIITFITEATS